MYSFADSLPNTCSFKVLPFCGTIWWAWINHLDSIIGGQDGTSYTRMGTCESKIDMRHRTHHHYAYKSDNFATFFLNVKSSLCNWEILLVLILDVAFWSLKPTEELFKHNRRISQGSLRLWLDSPLTL